MLAQYDEKDGFSFLNGGEIADDVADALNKLQPGMIATSDDFEKLAKKLGTSDQKFINFCTDLKNGNITLKEGQTYLQAYQENVTSLSARLKSFATSAKAFFKNLGGNLLAGTINALGGMLISSVVSLIGVGVSKLYKQISGKAAEEAKQEIQQLGETARSEFDSIQQNLSSTISTVVCHYPLGEVDGKIGGRNLIKNGKGNVKAGFFKNFPTVTDEYGEFTLKSKKTYKGIILDGFVYECRDYPVGEKYTWSYDIMYTAWNFPTGSNRGELWMGQRYVNAPSGETATGAWRGVTQHNLPVVGQNGCELNKWYHVKQTVTIPQQASSNVGQQGIISFYNSNANVEASFTARLKNVKLEKSSTATPWTPAPEDDASLCLTAMQNPAVAYLPYHSNGNECRMFPAKVLISLYLQMQLKITQETTKCNLLRVQLDGETDRDTIMSYTYDTPLNESYQAQYNEIIANTLEIIQGLIAGFMGGSGTTDGSDNTPDTDTSTSESGDSDGENTETTTEDTTAN